MMRTFRILLLGSVVSCLALALMGATNPPGIRPVPGTVASTNPPGTGALMPPSMPTEYATVKTDTNGQVIWPPHFWDSNSAFLPTGTGAVSGPISHVTNTPPIAGDVTIRQKAADGINSVFGIGQESHTNSSIARNNVVNWIGYNGGSSRLNTLDYSLGLVWEPWYSGGSLTDAQAEWYLQYYGADGVGYRPWASVIKVAGSGVGNIANTINADSTTFQNKAQTTTWMTIDANRVVSTIPIGSSKDIDIYDAGNQPWLIERLTGNTNVLWLGYDGTSYYTVGVLTNSRTSKILSFQVPVSAPSLETVCTPQQFGAKGDGVTDDTVALQSWLNYGSTNHMVCFLPPASGAYYKFTSTLVATNVSIKGTGGNMYSAPMDCRSRLNLTGVASRGLVFYSPGEHQQLQDFMVTCDTYDYSTAGICFVGFGGTINSSVLKHVGVVGFGRGFYLHSIAEANFIGCVGWQNGDNVFCGVLGADYAQSYIENVKFQGCSLFLDYSNSVVLSGNCLQANLTLDSCGLGYPGGYSTANHHAVIGGAGRLNLLGCEAQEDGTGAAQSTQPLITVTNGCQLLVMGCNFHGGRSAYTISATNSPITVFSSKMEDNVSGNPIRECQVSGAPLSVVFPQLTEYYSANSGSSWSTVATGVTGSSVETLFNRAGVKAASATFDLISTSGQDWELYSDTDSHFGIYSGASSKDWFTISSAGVTTCNGGGITNLNLTGPTNAVAPSAPSTVVSWVNFTDANGRVFKMPLYQ
ncbi:MAG TPA: hypothetical protein VG167_00900 [Verrucomicrobiae bacterium]|nr:hypothetical protein [Verrucomicrobiae bacterium]